ncbi:MAG TPA: ABC transporter ATP-binding protein [Longimicrobium sp.]|jgi:ABC-2 type transport system ATP-binding protein|uniref:ABC transporter ATP-binding protein n=1 Tax=Longimicrobium sp. TaxID=2029185 RepID=UPI002ED9DD96
MSFPALPTHLDGAELAIETRSLMKRFDGTRALAGLDLEVPAGAVYVLAGPNGSGKSTAIKVLLDLVRADRGTARVLGIETTADPALARAQIGYVPETSETGYEWLTAERFLRHHAAFFETWDPGYAALLCRRLKVPLRAAMRDLSKGALRSVILVSALAHRPPVLLLDEPTDGLDPLAREELMALLVDHLADAPTTLLWSTHHVHEVERMADHVGVLRNGRLVLQAPRDEVRLRLRRYRAGVPEGWTGAPELNGEVLLREGDGREVALTVWGEEREVAERLAAAGATVHDASPLSLEEATVALLRAGRRA